MNGVPPDLMQAALHSFVQQHGRMPSREEVVNLHALAQQHAFQRGAGGPPMTPQQLATPDHMGSLLGRMQPGPMPWGNFPYPDGQPTVPPAGWEQQPDRPVEQHRKDQPTIRWGDTANLTIEQSSLGVANGQSGYVLDCQLWRPAICLVRLSAQTDAITALDANWLLTWSLTIGVGSSSQVKQRQIQIAPATDPTVDTDLVITWPLQLLRVQAFAQVGPGTGTVTVNATAHVAPFSNFEGMVR